MSNYNFKLKIKNFGPIHEGFSDDDGFFSLSRLNVFIGEQGTGKSTIVKLISTLLWIEKSFVREEQHYQTFTANDFFNLCQNQRIETYFTHDTFICFQSDIFSFTYENSIFTVTKKKKTSEYESKKIMYIPSERNFISVVEEAENKSGLPYTIINTLEEFIIASKALGQNKLKLPLNGYEYFYDKTGKTAYIHDHITGSTVKLANSSSGLQSFVPLYVISNYLANNVTHEFFENLKNFSLSDRNKAEDIISSFYKGGINEKSEVIIQKLKRFYQSGLLNEFTDNDKVTLKSLLSSLLNVCFYNIVEEPEQNLFPTSQVAVVESLIKAMNVSVNNSLFITTHSPYILSAINNYLYDCSSVKNYGDSDISNDVWIQAQDCCAYLVKDGKISNIMDDDLGMIDTTIIDNCATLLNEQYDEISKRVDTDE